VPNITTLAIETVGWIGALLILAAYVLLSTERISSNSRMYQWMNVIGASCFIVNSGWNGAIPSAVLNIIWLFIGAYALWNIAKRPSTPEPSTSATSSKTE
jgi:hypothetical protein